MSAHILNGKTSVPGRPEANSIVPGLGSMRIYIVVRAVWSPADPACLGLVAGPRGAKSPRVRGPRIGPVWVRAVVLYEAQILTRRYVIRKSRAEDAPVVQIEVFVLIKKPLSRG